ncbi:sel1 repeat family protein [Ectothiorhodospiraceae bacterium 2226]|nr:sel1 repeat family protein [Ectothiorhodospiraceae bacterium 2226]
MPRDEAAQLALLQADAEAGVARAQRHLANRYLRGRGIQRDEAVGMMWLRRAAEQGLPQAQRELGEYLERGAGERAAVLEEAGRWYYLAARSGDRFAREHLARLAARRRAAGPGNP